MKNFRLTKQGIEKQRREHKEWVKEVKNREQYLLIKKIAISMLKKYYRQ